MTNGGAVANRLARSNSPYLLQHADNPVDWFEWEPEAFAEARRRDVPIFLSVGYSSCHWCHVMAHESFEDEAVATFLNDHFVSIKVDREVRPDVDSVYMTATQALAGQGGWPMSVWLDHELRPFYAGTYFPPRPAHGMPSFQQVLAALAEAWEQRRDEIHESAASIAASLVAHNEGAAPSATGSLDEAAQQSAVALVVERAWDRDRGGFGRAPKFPQAMTISWLLDHHVVTGDHDALAAATSSLTAMARGGIHDHVGGGFARYSTDAGWLVPHFEKMLYDNGLLLDAYASAAAITGRDDLARVASGIATWLVEDMQADRGGFHAALDADTDGEEGATYTWSDHEFREVVAAAGVDVDLAAAWFGVRTEGNFRPERGEAAGDNIVHTATSLRDFAAANDLDPDQWQQQVEVATTALRERRASRLQPGRDDKVLVGWNALAVRGLVRAGAMLGQPDWIAAAERAVDFVRAEMVDADGRLLHVHRAGESSVPAFLDDVAGLATALLELAPAAGRPELLAWARELVDDALDRFADGTGGFASTAADAEELIVRPRDDRDGAQPSGTSLLAQATARLALLTGDDRYAEVARDLVAARADEVARAPTGFGELLRAARFLAADQREVAIVGAPSRHRAALAALVLGRPRPGTVTAVAEESAEPAVELLAQRTEVDGRPAAWVCRRFTCQRPVTTPDDLAALLEPA